MAHIIWAILQQIEYKQYFAWNGSQIPWIRLYHFETKTESYIRFKKSCDICLFSNRKLFINAIAPQIKSPLELPDMKLPDIFSYSANFTEWLKMIFLFLAKLNMLNFIWIKNDASDPELENSLRFGGIGNITYEEKVFSISKNSLHCDCTGF